jgi:cation diffusion facilitator family transporter
VSRVERLAVVLALNLVLVTGLVIVGLTAHSLGVLAAGADYLADAAAIAVSLFAIWLSARPPTTRRPDGYPKATAIAAAVNGGWLLILSLLVSAGAVDRLTSGTPHVDGLPVLIASSAASIVMLAGALILGGDVDTGDDDAGALNMRAVLIDTAADAAAAGGVAVTGAVILASGGVYWLDPTIALAIALIVGYHALALLNDVRRTLRRPATRPRSQKLRPPSGRARAS